MTVVATFMTKAGTVHASDSLLSATQPDGTNEFLEWQQTKIVQVRPWSGAISYFGLAGVPGRFETLAWLRDQASRAGDFESAQAFAEHLARALQSELSRLGLVGPRAVGVGLHFTAYERFDDSPIPELFHVRNFADPSYSAVFPEGVRVSRETWGLIHGQPSDLAHGDPARRLQVRDFIQNGGWLRFNNGDPALFNTVANALQGAVEVMGSRGQLRPLGLAEYTAVARRSVELVAQLQGEIGLPGTRRVGGRIHDLAVTPTGEYSSTSGDTT